MERLVIIFYWLAFMLFGAAFVFYLYLFVAKRNIARILSTTCMVAGLMALTFSFLARWYAAGFISFEGSFETFALFAWFVVLGYLIVELLTELRILGLVIMPLTAILLGLGWAQYGAPAKVGVFGLYWIAIHVGIIFFAYGGFALAAALGIFYLLQEWQLKSGAKSILLLHRLPSLNVLDKFSARAVEVAEPFMTMGIITGVIRAEQEVGSWYADPLVLSTTVVWLIYAFYLLARWKLGWRGKRSAILAILGFLIILAIRFVAVNYSTIFRQFGV